MKIKICAALLCWNDDRRRVTSVTVSSLERLFVNGDIRGSGYILAGGAVCGSNISCSSSRRFKTNIQTMAGALEKVERLRGVIFNWEETGKHDIGLIAEEVRDVVPEVVTYREWQGCTRFGLRSPDGRAHRGGQGTANTVKRNQPPEG
ncbi:MAG: tail fiber domain-containing protein [Acidobacteria bacterium]|nr:tail fiber domain-containing protein [Acidobacteriota bacterium]